MEGIEIFNSHNKIQKAQNAIDGKAWTNGNKG
jgi:hypothetical protein